MFNLKIFLKNDNLNPHLMKTTCLTLLLLSTWVASAQYGTSSNTQDWRNIVLVSRVEGVNTSGMHFEYLQNTNNWWNDWLLPWRVSIKLADIRTEKFEKSDYIKASFNHATIGMGGYKTLSDRLYLNIDAGVILGSENLTPLRGNPFDHFFVGLSSFQGILFVPSTKWALVLKAGVYEEVLTSKLYGYDLGINLGVGFKF